MSAVESESPPPPPVAPAKASAAGLLIPVLLAAVLSSAMAAGAVWFVSSRHGGSEAPTAAAESGHAETAHAAHAAAPAPAAPKGAAQYLSLSPAFTVNLAEPDSSHFLQIDMEVMSRDAAGLEAVKANMPQIRNALLLLLGQLKIGDIATRESKQGLQKRVAEEIQKVLAAETGKPGIDSVYFTSFVVQ